MKARCNNPKSSGYKNYGGRGIKICERWGSFFNFLQDIGKKPDGLTLDRKDVDGDYTPSNCRWASIQDQNNNRRDTVWVEFAGELMSAKQASKKLAVPYERIRWAVDRYGDDWMVYAMSPTAGIIQRNSTTGFKGVSFHKASGKFHARIYISRTKNKSVGYFNSAEEANSAIVRAAAEIGRSMP